MEKYLEEVPFIIEQNPNGSYAIIENPDSKVYGRFPFYGDQVVRSPFNSAEEARQRMKEIAAHYWYKSVELS